MIQDKQLRQLGATGLVVSPLGLGTNRWAYGKNDEAVSETFRAYVDAGGNFFDTAEVYGFGKSEHLLGACLKQDARPTVIASKYMPLPLHPFQKALDGRSEVDSNANHRGSEWAGQVCLPCARVLRSHGCSWRR